MITYKHLNLFFYRFAQFLLVGGTLAFPFGLIYLLFVSFTFDLNTFIFSILYMLIPMVTGTLITEEYEKYISKEVSSKHGEKKNDWKKRRIKYNIINEKILIKFLYAPADLFVQPAGEHPYS